MQSSFIEKIRRIRKCGAAVGLEMGQEPRCCCSAGSAGPPEGGVAAVLTGGLGWPVGDGAGGRVAARRCARSGPLLSRVEHGTRRKEVIESED
jgi:hypothetical protein